MCCFHLHGAVPWSTFLHHPECVEDQYTADNQDYIGAGSRTTFSQGYFHKMGGSLARLDLPALSSLPQFGAHHPSHYVAGGSSRGRGAQLGGCPNRFAQAMRRISGSPSTTRPPCPATFYDAQLAPTSNGQPVTRTIRLSYTLQSCVPFGKVNHDLPGIGREYQ